MDKRKSFSKSGIILIILLLAAAAVLSLAFRLFGGKENNVAVVKFKNEEIYRIELSSVIEPYELEINDGCEIKIRVENSRICVEYSSCPDKICVHAGWLSEKGDTAVCLPNLLTVHIE